MTNLRIRAALAASVAGLAVGCAQAYPPPGGEVPRVPPDIVSTSPAHLETIDPGAGPLVFQFDRRISEQGVEGAVRISPETGELRVDRGRDQIRVSVEGGWRPNTVYRVVLGAGVRDLFGNQRQYPTEVVFSTGPAITETALAGIVTDRISGQPVSGPSLRVEAVSMSDSTTYVETTDRSGVFAMRYLPQGNYVVRAYLDQNRNRRLDETEARAITATSLAEGDTTLVTLAILAPDSTPAQVVTATARDSTTIVVRTDDYMDPTVPLGVAVRVQRASDGADIPVDTILYPHQDAALTAALRRAPAPAPEAAAEDPPADTVDAPDSAAAASDTTAAGPGGAKEPESPLPVRELVVWLAVPLTPGERYVIQVNGVVNIAGVLDGGGSAELTGPARPPQPAEEPAPVAPPEGVPGVAEPSPGVDPGGVAPGEQPAPEAGEPDGQAAETP